MKRILKKQFISYLVCMVFLISTLWTALYTNKWQSANYLVWDVTGYYNYIPSIFLYKDVKQLKFYERIDSIYHPSREYPYYALERHPETQNRVNKYSMGVAYFELPFFVVADAYTKFDHYYPHDGYSPPFQLAILFATLIVTFFALLILRRFLLECGFSDGVTAMCLIILGFGTNLFMYCAFHPSMSHPFSFFLYSALLLLTLRLYKTFQLKYFLLLGLCIGWATLIRPIDIFMVLFPLFWSGKYFVRTIHLFLTRYKKAIMLSLLLALIPWIPQFIYWKITTNSWLYYSYNSEGFNFANPEIMNGLFSYQKGWFVYTPLAFFGVLSLLLLWRIEKFRTYLFISLAYFTLSIYVIFSWWQWYYGGSFGARVMINSLPLLAIPFCVLIQYILQKKWWVKSIAAVALFFFIYLNLYQSWQYNRAIIHWDAMNKKYYWRIFLKSEATEEDRKLL